MIFDREFKNAGVTTLKDVLVDLSLFYVAGRYVES